MMTTKIVFVCEDCGTTQVPYDTINGFDRYEPVCHECKGKIKPTRVKVNNK